tara:strand:- start:1660 stop:2439 length:780 start_codon:yes stop_codon:yes gene_type:complete
MTNNTSHAHIHEFIPSSSSNILSIDKNHLELLHQFMLNNPIYSSFHESKIDEIPCTIYEGDVTHFWLDSIKHDTSYAPFYPTWMLSAYTLALISKNLGVDHIIDIGSGDGRIAYCGKVVGIESYGIEIDENLVLLQKSISNDTKVNFNIKLDDATKFDYTSLNLSQPIFFLSGLPEQGELLANSVIEKILNISNLKNNAMFVFMGSYSKRKYTKDDSKFGWGKIIDFFDLNIVKTVTLPTYWTSDQPIDTPFIFTKLND